MCATSRGTIIIITNRGRTYPCPPYDPEQFFLYLKNPSTTYLQYCQLLFLPPAPPLPILLLLGPPPPSARAGAWASLTGPYSCSPLGRAPALVPVSVAADVIHTAAAAVHPVQHLCRMYHREAACSRRWLGYELGKHGVQCGQLHRRVGCESAGRVRTRAGALWTYVRREVLVLVWRWRWRAGSSPSGTAPEVAFGVAVAVVAIASF